MASNGGGWTESSTLNSTNGIRIIGFRSDQEGEQEAQVHARTSSTIGKVHGSQDRTLVLHEEFYQDRPSIINMRSPLLTDILGRPQRTLREAIRMEFGIK